MGTFKARVLYEFVGEPNTAELTVKAGEIVTVTRTDVGEGWWEGLNSAGFSGLFPEAYVERVSSGPPAIPAPVLPVKDDNNQQYPYAVTQDDDWDDDWDNDDTYSEIGNVSVQHHYEQNHNLPKVPEPDNVSEFGTDNRGLTHKNKTKTETELVRRKC